MKFSIIIPCYKVEDYLSDCVESVLKQTYTDYELILVDDGSPDLVPKMCDEFAMEDSRVIVIHQENEGLASARNAGIAIAKGEYLICIDSDDYLVSNDVLERIEQKTKSGVDVILFGYQKLFESNNSKGEKIIPTLIERCSTYEMLRSVLNSNTYCGTAWTKAVRLSLLHEHNIEFKPKMISEDIDWYLYILCYAKSFDSLNDIAIIYRQRSGSISHDPKINSLTDNLWILEHWPARIKSIVRDQPTIDALMSVLAYYFSNILILYASYSNKQIIQYKNRLKNQDFLLNFAVTPRALIIKKFYYILGFNNTIFLLKVLSMLKKRK